LSSLREFKIKGNVLKGTSAVYMENIVAVVDGMSVILTHAVKATE